MRLEFRTRAESIAHVRASKNVDTIYHRAQDMLERYPLLGEDPSSSARAKHSSRSSWLRSSPSAPHRSRRPGVVQARIASGQIQITGLVGLFPQAPLRSSSQTRRKMWISTLWERGAVARSRLRRPIRELSAKTHPSPSPPSPRRAESLTPTT